MNPPAITPAAPVAAMQPSGSSGSAISAFQAALRDVGQAFYTDPSAVGRALLSGVDGFKLRESHLQGAMGRVTAADGAGATDRSSSMLDAAPSSSISSVAPPSAAAGPESSGSALRDSSAKAMGVMMETYNFALQTSLVTNAATTFTSSINTLIKTQ